VPRPTNQVPRFRDQAAGSGEADVPHRKRFLFDSVDLLCGKLRLKRHTASVEFSDHFPTLQQSYHTTERPVLDKSLQLG